MLIESGFNQIPIHRMANPPHTGESESEPGSQSVWEENTSDNRWYETATKTWIYSHEIRYLEWRIYMNCLYLCPAASIDGMGMWCGQSNESFSYNLQWLIFVVQWFSLLFLEVENYTTFLSRAYTQNTMS